MIVLSFQEGLDFSVEVTEERRQRTGSLDFKVAGNSISVSVQVPAFILQIFIPMGCVEFILFLNDHVAVRLEANH